MKRGASGEGTESPASFRIRTLGCGDLSDPVLRETDQPRIAVGGEIDPLKIEFDNLVEDPLVIPHHDKLTRGLALKGCPPC